MAVVDVTLKWDFD